MKQETKQKTESLVLKRADSRGKGLYEWHYGTGYTELEDAILIVLTDRDVDKFSSGKP